MLQITTISLIDLKFIFGIDVGNIIKHYYLDRLIMLSLEN